MNFRQVHLDFHTGPHIPGVGSRFNKEQFQKALKAGHVNSITLFSKCHHGFSYHPSEHNDMHPSLTFDLLAAQIEAAHEIGVKTPVYLSGGHDENYARKHPEHRLRYFQSKADEWMKYDDFTEDKYHSLCMNSPYLDVLSEQVKEVCRNYDADGIFIDIVGVRPCTCSYCIKEMFARGMNPASFDDALKLGEETYAKYHKAMRDAIDSVKPGLSLFHNGGHIRQGRRDLAFMNTHFELESLPTGGWGYDHFPFSAKYVENLGLDYLGMTGKFHFSWGEFGGFKHPNALRYEVALNAAMGAKTSIGDQMHPFGEMDMSTYELIGEAYSELEEKEPWLDNAETVADVAVLSKESILNRNSKEKLGGGVTIEDTGANRILLEGKYAYTVIDCDVDFNKYKVIILADSISFDDELLSRLKEFVSHGGKILASGSSAIENGKFLFDLGAEYVREGEYNPSYMRPSFDKNGSDYILYGAYNVVKATGKEIAKAVKPFFNRTPEHFCSHKHAPSSGEAEGAGATVGKDGAYISWEIFTEYATNGDLAAKKLVMCVLDELLGKNKTIVTNLGAQGVTNLMYQKNENRYVAHLVYGVPTKRGSGVEIIEDLYPVYDVDFGVKIPETVKRVYLAPQNEEIPYIVENGYIKTKIRKVDCHQMVVYDI